MELNTLIFLSYAIIEISYVLLILVTFYINRRYIIQPDVDILLTYIGLVVTHTIHILLETESYQPIIYLLMIVSLLGTPLYKYITSGQFPTIMYLSHHQIKIYALHMLYSACVIIYTNLIKVY
jgi:hypothetical protein